MRTEGEAQASRKMMSATMIELCQTVDDAVERMTGVLASIVDRLDHLDDRLTDISKFLDAIAR